MKGPCDLGYSERSACRLVGMNRSTYYDQQSRPISNTALRRALLSEVISNVHAESRATYGQEVATSLPLGWLSVDGLICR